MTGLTGEAGALVCDNYHILRDLVLETDCIWLSTTALVGEEIAEGRMTVLDPAEFRPIHSDITLITRLGRTISPAAMAVVEHVRILLASVRAEARPSGAGS
jgi:DNA-binding transcriptional LysR family regulator